MRCCGRFVGALSLVLVTSVVHGESVALFRAEGATSGVPISYDWRISESDACHAAIGGLVDGNGGDPIEFASYDSASPACVVRAGATLSTVGFETSSADCESGSVWRWEYQQCLSDTVRQMYAVAFVLLCSVALFAGWRIAVSMV
jgi:hypothetical protein